MWPQIIFLSSGLTPKKTDSCFRAAQMFYNSHVVRVQWSNHSQSPPLFSRQLNRVWSDNWPKLIISVPRLFMGTGSFTFKQCKVLRKQTARTWGWVVWPLSRSQHGHRCLPPPPPLLTKHTCFVILLCLIHCTSSYYSIFSMLLHSDTDVLIQSDMF